MCKFSDNKEIQTKNPEIVRKSKTGTGWPLAMPDFPASPLASEGKACYDRLNTSN